jgi:HEAT repeat protein
MTDALTAAIDAPRYDDAAVVRLLELLAAADAGGSPAAALDALGRIGRHPRLLLRLDEGIRRITWQYADRPVPAIEALLARAERDGAGPIAVAVGSLHRYGRVRERVVRSLAARALPELTPFLVLRVDDWVGPVRQLARETLARLLDGDRGPILKAAVPTAVKIADRDRGRYAFELVHAAVLAAPDDLRRRWAADPDRDLRRLVFDVDLSQNRLDLGALTGIAVRESDGLIRHRAAEAAYAEAVEREDRAVLRRLGAAKPAGVRALGLTGLLRLGPAPEAVAALDDPAPLVRAIAREAARRAGIDAVAHYRTAEPTVGSVAGLAETGTDRDAPLLTSLLDHPSGRIRAAAVRGLGRLGAVPVDRVLLMLQDPAAAVVREAAVVLGPFERRVPPELPWQLLENARAEVRRAGYRLLHGRDPATRFRAALLLAVDADARNAGRGEQDALRLAHRPRFRGLGFVLPWPVLAEMRALVEQDRALPGPLTDRLRALLDQPG